MSSSRIAVATAAFLAGPLVAPAGSASAQDDAPTEVADSIPAPLALVDTRWVRATAGSAPFVEMVFGERWVAFLDATGRTYTSLADYSAAHPACLGYPGCVMTLDGEGRAAPLFAALHGSLLYLAECREFPMHPDGTQRAERDTFVAGLGANLSWQGERAVCWNPADAPFTAAPLLLPSLTPGPR